MEVLEAYDLTRSFKAAAELVGCSHHTVQRYVEAREAGRLVVGEPVVRPMLIDEFLPKLEEWMQHSSGKIRADVAHEKLLALGYLGSERTTRRAVAAVRRQYRIGRTRVHRPWVPEPGMWLQYDFGDGPVVAGVRTTLFCAWVAWSRFRVVLPILDKTLPSVFAALDVTLRRLGGAPTYVLTDNEKTVTIDHVAGIPVRNRNLLGFAQHYGVTVHTCEPADPASKGGSENTVKIAKADLVPTQTNLLEQYATFADFEAACEEFCEQVNDRPHRVTRRRPIEMLAEERARLHPLPERPHTVAFGVTRTVPPHTPMITLDHAQYSVPDTLLGQQVWVRTHGVGDAERVVIVHVGPAGPVEVARHRRARPGTPKVDDTHFSDPAPAGPLNRQPRAKSQPERDWLRACAMGMRVQLCPALLVASSCLPADGPSPPPTAGVREPRRPRPTGQIRVRGGVGRKAVAVAASRRGAEGQPGRTGDQVEVRYTTTSAPVLVGSADTRLNEAGTPLSGNSRWPAPSTRGCTMSMNSSIRA